jgi:hypothetical protein
MFRIGETVNVPLAGSQVPVLEPPRASEKAETPALNWPLDVRLAVSVVASLKVKL